MHQTLTVYHRNLAQYVGFCIKGIWYTLAAGIIQNVGAGFSNETYLEAVRLNPECFKYGRLHRVVLIQWATDDWWPNETPTEEYPTLEAAEEAVRVIKL